VETPDFSVEYDGKGGATVSWTGFQPSALGRDGADSQQWEVLEYDEWSWEHRRLTLREWLAVHLLRRSDPRERITRWSNYEAPQAP
jgi:hypothetical protein